MPHAVWTADAKGQCKLGRAAYCSPLTIADGYSRMRLACQGLQSAQRVEARPIFERLVRDYGLPARLRSDNGVPFASQALGRLATLAVWWIRLGLLPDLMPPASPQQNARHERMPRTLKRECTRPPERTRPRPSSAERTPQAQQRRFDTWREEYNTVRPHEGLDDATPAACYTPSPRRYPRRLAPLEYPGHYEVRRVSRHGGSRWHQPWVNVSQTRGEADVGLTEIDDGEWDRYVGPLRLGRLHERTMPVEDALGRTHRRPDEPLSPMSCDLPVTHVLDCSGGAISADAVGRRQGGYEAPG